MTPHWTDDYWTGNNREGASSGIFDDFDIIDIKTTGSFVRQDHVKVKNNRRDVGYDIYVVTYETPDNFDYAKLKSILKVRTPGDNYSYLIHGGKSRNTTYLTKKQMKKFEKYLITFDDRMGKWFKKK